MEDYSIIVLKTGGIKMYNYPITRYMGFAIIILAVIDLFSVSLLPPVVLLGFSVSALLLTIIDLIEFKANEKDDPFKYRKTKLVVLFISISFFIIVPNISVEWDKEIMDNINSLCVLLSIGFLFIIIGYKQEKVADDKLLKIIDEKIEETVDNALEHEIDKMLKDKDFTGEIMKAIERIEGEQSQKTKV